MEEQTIHDKYRELILKANSGYVSDYTTADLMKILRWCEAKIGRNIATNLACTPCIINLVILFRNLE
jgi:hypothetical protein